MSQIKGKISQIIGPVIDVSFENSENLPNLLDAIEIIKKDGTKVILECQKHIGEDSVRTVAMDSTDGQQEVWRQFKKSYHDANRRQSERQTV